LTQRERRLPSGSPPTTRGAISGANRETYWRTASLPSRSAACSEGRFSACACRLAPTDGSLESYRRLL